MEIEEDAPTECPTCLCIGGCDPAPHFANEKKLAARLRAFEEATHYHRYQWDTLVVFPKLREEANRRLWAMVSYE